MNPRTCRVPPLCGKMASVGKASCRLFKFQIKRTKTTLFYAVDAYIVESPIAAPFFVRITAATTQLGSRSFAALIA